MNSPSMSGHAAGVSALLIRLSVGLVVFFPEGIQKLMFPDALGIGRFARIGLPSPEVLAPFVATVEIICGLLLIVGLATRLAAIPLIGVMVVAIASTKIPILLGADWLIFHVPKMAHYGFWSMIHEARLDVVMLLCCVYLVIAGGGPLSLDGRARVRQA